MEKKFTIKRNEREFFRAYVELIKPFLKGTRTREADVFAELLYWNYKKQGIKDKEDRFMLILSKANRRAMEAALDMKKESFRNALTALRSRKLLDQDNCIPDAYLVSPKNKKFQLIFNFVVD